MNNNNWRYQIATPEQLEWAYQNKWPVEIYDHPDADRWERTYLDEDDAKAAERRLTCYYFDLVPKTIDELEVGDIINDKGTKREVSHLTNKRVFFKTEPCFETSVKKYELSDVQFMPYLPENIFPKE